MKLTRALITITLSMSAFLLTSDHGSFGGETSPTSQMRGLSVPFIANQGQVDDEVILYARTFGGDVFITTGGHIVYSLFTVEGMNISARSVFRETVVGGTIQGIRGENPSESSVNYFRGQDPAGWHSEVPAYDVVNFGEVCDGIELVLHARGDNVEKVFSVSPGADPEDIVIKIEGSDHIRRTPTGELEVNTPAGPVTFTRPTAYQDINGTRATVDVAYRVDGAKYGFHVGDYDHDRPLIIDPLLASTFLGGSGIEGGSEYWWIWTDLGPDGSVYIGSMTSSSDFPATSGAHDEHLHGNYDICVAKLDRDLTALQAATYIGGNHFDRCWSIAVAEDGDVYVSGMTQSSDFPTTVDAYDRIRNGSSEAFISKLSGDLTTLLASTYLGGNGYEGRPRIALDGDGHVFISGTTDQNSFPATAGAYDESYNGGSDDFFVSKFDSDLTTLLSSTFLGGIYHEWWPSITIDTDGNVYVAGSSGSYNFPVTAGAYDTSFNGEHTYGQWNLDVFVSKLNNDLTSLLASTFIGADDYQGCLHLILDEAENVFVSGHTWDPNYPTTPGALDEVFSGDEYFISKLDNTLSHLLVSTFTTPNDAGLGHVWEMKTDGKGSLYMVGTTSSSDFFVTSNAYDITFNGGNTDAYLMKLDDNLTTLIYSTFLGGSGDEGASSLAIDENGHVYIVGYTNSAADFPISHSAYDNTYNGGNSDAFIARFTFDTFTRILEGDPVSDGGNSFGAAWVDYDNDAYPDLFVTNWPVYTERNCLYHNNGDGTFSKVTSGPIVAEGGSFGSTWGDVDNDGDLDVYCANAGYFNEDGGRNYFYLNSGDGTFTKLTEGIVATEVSRSTTPAWGDYDNDGDLDLFVGTDCWSRECSMPPSLFRNDAGELIKMNNADIGLTEDFGSGLWADYDSDGDADLYIWRAWLNTNALFENNGDGTFIEKTSGPIVEDSSSASSWADYDNDGDLDLFITRGHPVDMVPNILYENIGLGDFVTVTGLEIVEDRGHWHCSSWGDYDNDGDLDVFVTSNYSFFALPNAMYENNGDGTFTKVTRGEVVSDTGYISTGAVWGDYDRDGDLDLFIANQDYKNNMLYRNNGNSNNWIDIKCIGTISNRSAIGAKVHLLAIIDGIPVWQLREISAQNSYVCQNSLNAHFGLRDAPFADSIKVEWPSGMIDILTIVDVNQFLTITEGEYGDLDGDGIADIEDNCPDQANPGQEDGDTDGIGDICDNCIDGYNPNQGDADSDGSGDVCDPCTDTDEDGYGDPGYAENTCEEDNCPETYNPDQEPVEKGDVNCEGGINILDVLATVNHILGTAPLTGAPFDRADCNDDGSVNVLDALSIVNIILGTIPECPSGGYKPDVTPDVLAFCQYLETYLPSDEYTQFMNLVKGEIKTPSEYHLYQNYPNPFNPETTIAFALPKAGHIKLQVYNILGQKVAELINAALNAGYHEITWNGSDMNSGVFLLRLETDGFVGINKMVLIR